MANATMTVIPLSSPSLITPIINSLTQKSPTKPVFTKISSHPFRKAITKRPLSFSSSQSSSFQTEAEEALSIAALQSFINLNLGNWVGSFYQFNPNGEMLNKVATKLAVSSYGEDDLVSLIQTLYIKQPTSSSRYSGEDDEPEWAEYKIKETNMFTVDKYQQINIFPEEKAFVLRYQTAGMLETVLRQGVLGEDDIGEEFPKNLMLPSRRPAIVCESCLFSLEKDMRARAFHIMDPKGIIEMLLLFLEERGSGVLIPPSLDDLIGNTNRILPHIGRWKGHSITKRSGVYGATIAVADTTAVLEFNDKGQLIQDISSTSKSNDVKEEASSTSNSADVTTNVHWTGTMLNNLVTFDGGFQLTLLPGGMYMGCPCDVSKSVAESKSFHLEFCWLESADKRQRLVRTYDVEGLAVSSTYFTETKL